jgi:adenosylcobinamide-GDP ribazoletransferase
MRAEVPSPQAQAENDFLAELRLAASFLTILPLIDRRPASDEAVARSFAWFPAVGLAIGVALAAEDWILAYVFAQVIRSVLIVASLTIVTGAVHLDGLADTADALGAGRERERALEILRDSRVGTFGASAIFFDLTLKILALSMLTGYPRYAALIVAPTLARWAMTVAGLGLPYLRESGAGSTLLNSQSYGRGMGLAIGVISGMLILVGWRTYAVVICVAFVIVLAMRSFYRRWLGGVTGDLIGACGELVEIAVLVTIASGPYFTFIG